MVKTTHLEFISRKEIKQITEEKFSKEKFEKEFANNPHHLTQEQIALIGHDALRHRLFDSFLRSKFAFQYEKENNESNKVIGHLHNLIKSTLVGVPYEVRSATIKTKKYDSPDYLYANIIVGDIKSQYIKFTPTLDKVDHFQVDYETDNFSGKRFCRDVDVIGQIESFKKYLADGTKLSLVNNVHLKYDNQYALCFLNDEICLYDVEMVQLYHTLAKCVNGLCGTQYPYSQKVIDRLYKQSVFGNIQYVGEFKAKGRRYDEDFELLSTYFYEDDNTKKPTFQCCATYGYYTKEGLCALLDTLQPYATSNYFAESSKESLGEKYGFYDAHRIGYRQRPNYFHLLECEND